MFTVIVVGVLVVGAIVGTYFFLRNNKDKKAKIDGFVNKVDGEIKKVVK